MIGLLPTTTIFLATAPTGLRKALEQPWSHYSP